MIPGNVGLIDCTRHGERMRLNIICSIVVASLITFGAPAWGQEPDKEINFAETKRAAEKGDVNAQNTLGAMYASGLNGVEPNILEAIRWWTKAAENGDMVAQYNLGTAYEQGRGVTQDYAMAFKWYTLA